MPEILDPRPDRWRPALRLAGQRRLALSARVILEPDCLTVVLSNGISYSAPRTVSDESAIAAAIQWSRRHGATAVTVVR
jgi:hypothetical protein